MKNIWANLGAYSLLAAAPLLAANSNTASHDRQVLSRLEQAGGGHSKLTLYHADGKRYLYAHRASDASLTIYDVTNEEKPSIVRTLTHEHLGNQAQLHLLPNGSALIASSAAGAADTSYSLALWQPGEGNAASQVGNATSHLVEERRGLLYFSDDRGLTILRLHESPEKRERALWDEAQSR